MVEHMNIFDKTQMITSVGSEKNFHSILPDLRQQFQESIQLLPQLIQAQKWDVCFLELHKLKSTALMGFPHLLQLIRLLEPHFQRKRINQNAVREAWEPIDLAIIDILSLLSNYDNL